MSKYAVIVILCTTDITIYNSILDGSYIIKIIFEFIS